MAGEPGAYRRFDTEGGVIWRFRTVAVRPVEVAVSVVVLVAVAVPLALAAGAVAVGFAESAALVARVLAGLFVAQMLLVAGLVGWLAGIAWVRVVASLFGTYELELKGERLYLGLRLGPWRPGRWREVADLREVVLFLCTDPPGPDGAVPAPVACVAVVEGPGEPPFPYFMALAPAEGRELADDLAHSLRAVKADPFPPVRVVETTMADVMTLPALWSADPHLKLPRWLRRRWWVLYTLLGSLGLIGLSVAVLTQPAPRPAWAGGTIAVGWLLELLFLIVRVPTAPPPPPSPG